MSSLALAFLPLHPTDGAGLSGAVALASNPQAAYDPRRVNAALHAIRRILEDGTVWHGELQQVYDQVLRLTPTERRSLVNLMAQPSPGGQSLLDAWLGEVTTRGLPGLDGLTDGHRQTLFAHLVAAQDPANLERVFHAARNRHRGESADTSFQMEYVQQVVRRGTPAQRLGLVDRLADDAARGDAAAAGALAALVSTLPDRAAEAQALARLDRRTTDAMVRGALTWRNEIVTSPFGAVAAVTRLDTRRIEALSRQVAQTGNAREKASFVAAAGTLLRDLREADIQSSARGRGVAAVASAMSRVIGSDVNGVIENTLLQNDREGASSGRRALREYAAALIDSRQGAHLGAITLSLQRGNDLRQDPMQWLSARLPRSGETAAYVRAAVLGDWLGLVGAAVQARISRRDQHSAYAALMFTGSIDVLKELAGASFPALKLPIGVGAAVLKPALNGALLQWRTGLARADRDFARNLYETALPHHPNGVEARGEWVTTMNAQFFASLQRQ